MLLPGRVGAPIDHSCDARLSLKVETKLLAWDSLVRFFLLPPPAQLLGS